MSHPISDRLALRDQFQALLAKTATAKERDKRQAMVPDPDDHDHRIPWREPAWALHERQIMCDEVNRLRATRGRPPVTTKDIMKVERCAAGHSDYSSKFSLYCAEIVMGESPNVP